MGYFYAEDGLTLSCVAKIDNTLKDRVLLELQIKVDDFKRVLSALMGEIHNHQVSNVESASTKTLLSFVTLCIERYAKRVGIDRSESSLCKYRV